MTMRPGVGRIIQLNKRIKELKLVLEPFAKCTSLVVSESVRFVDCGQCDGCKARKVLDRLK